ncbi:hypothetical protein [Paludisphaera sp.]|uniref:hypothetical protein n=1 Tax=Paludisphaera sp. TaxID=2017432 RepID=UPI00301DB854
MAGFLPSTRMRRSLAGAALTLLVAIACAPAEATAGCHRDAGGDRAAVGPTLENLRSLGALATPPDRADSLAHAASVPFGDPRGGCSGPLCSSDPEPASAPPSPAPAPLRAEWPAIGAAPREPDPTAAPAAPEARARWTNPPLAGVFHPPRGLAFAG